MRKVQLILINSLIFFLFGSSLQAQVRDELGSSIAMGLKKSKYKLIKTYSQQSSQKKIISIEKFNKLGYLLELNNYNDAGKMIKHVLVTYDNDSIPISMIANLAGAETYKELKQEFETNIMYSQKMDTFNLKKKKAYQQTWKFLRNDSMILVRCYFIGKVYYDTLFIQNDKINEEVNIDYFIDSIIDRNYKYIVSVSKKDSNHKSTKLISSKNGKVLNIQNTFSKWDGKISVSTVQYFYNSDDSLSMILSTIYENGKTYVTSNTFIYSSLNDTTTVEEMVEHGYDGEKKRKSSIVYSYYKSQIIRKLFNSSTDDNPCKLTMYNSNGDVIEYKIFDCNNNQVYDHLFFEYLN